MIRFSDVAVNDPKCYKTAPSGEYPSLFIGKAIDFKSERFPLFENFNNQNVKVEAMKTCDIADVMLATDQSTKMFEIATNEIIKQDRKATIDAKEFEKLYLRQMMGSKLSKYYKTLKYPSSWIGGSRRKSRRKTLKRKRRTRTR